MHLIAIVIALALLEYVYITFQVGQGRGKYGVPAPAISGDPTFERLYRVQMNTVEQLVIFLPAIVFFGLYVSEPIGALIGLVFVLGRAVYFAGYVKAAEKRGTGFLITFAANMVLVLGGLIGAAMQAF